MAGGDRNLLLVIGEGVDTNKLTKKLKKKVGSAEIVELRTLDSFEAALPLAAAAAAVMGSKESMAYAAARSPYHQWQYATAPSPYAYPYHHPSPMAAHGGGYGAGSSYSRAVARSHPANYSPLVEKHDYYPMDHSSSRASFKTVSRSRHESDTNSCSIL
ncbi:hypothetical protein ABZP36_031980 [Zizania latifolia]